MTARRRRGFRWRPSELEKAMPTALYTHPACLGHNVPEGHPERPARLKAVLQALEGDDFAPLVRREAPLAGVDDLALVHPRPYIEAVLTCFPESGFYSFDPDTLASPGTREAALRAVGAVVAAVDAVMTGEAGNAFCAVRPPGHHAEPERVMGFCFFNAVAIGDCHARHAHAIGRVAVVDFDVHHGNGTQAAFWDDPDLFYASSHQAPFYPGTGAESERGGGGGVHIVNVPLAAGTDGAAFRAAWEARILPRLAAFRPELVLVSAGFDAHQDDPLGQMSLTEEDYAWITRELCAVAADSCDGRLVSVLEGGYDLSALGRSAAAHVRALMSAQER